MKFSDSMRQFAAFWICNRRFGVDIKDVKEVNSEMTFTPIFHAGDEIRGYVNIRGQIYIVIDLAYLLGFGTTSVSENTRLILFKPQIGESMAIIVDRIGDVVAIEDRSIEKYHSDSQNAELYAGICKLKNDILMILDAGKLTAAVEKFEISIFEDTI